MRLPEAIREVLAARYKSQRCNWLRGDNADGKWPLVLRLGDPTEEDVTPRPGALATWIGAWRACQGPGDVVWTERRWRHLGTQRLPEALRLRTPEEVAAWVGEESRWRRARARYAALIVRWPALDSGLARHFDVLADYAAEDFQRLETILAWFAAHTASGLYPRQLPVPGLDSKWLETRTSLIGDLLGLLRGEDLSRRDFFELCGLKRMPQLVRMMLLDESLRRHVGGVRDLSVPIEELAGLELPLARVYVVENLQTGLAFGDLPGSVVFMRLGYAVDVLSRVPWIGRVECVYWGDIDTHGLRILGRARLLLPHVKSILMDEETLLAHRALWGEEAEQVSETDVPGLSDAERLLYRRLKQHHWGVNLRLEQERIEWGYAWRMLCRGTVAVGPRNDDAVISEKTV